LAGQLGEAELVLLEAELLETVVRSEAALR